MAIDVSKWRWGKRLQTTRARETTPSTWPLIPDVADIERKAATVTIRAAHLDPSSQSNVTTSYADNDAK